MRENLQDLFKAKNTLNVLLLDLNLPETFRKVSSNYCREEQKVKNVIGVIEKNLLVPSLSC